VSRDPRYDGYKWKLTRAYIRSRDGGCVVCGATEGLEVDHVVRPEDGGPFYDEANLRTLCGLHHRRKTANAVMVRRGQRPRPRSRKRLQRW
jgi:5-methylcytosine-specific restriction endonuclease McrA